MRWIRLANVLVLTVVWVVGTRRHWSSLECFVASFVIVLLDAVMSGIRGQWVHDRKFDADSERSRLHKL